MSRSSPAVRRYVWRLSIAMTVYLAALFGANYAERLYHPTGTALIMLAILPALPIIGVVGVIALYLVEERDEFIRTRIVTSMMAGTGIMLGLATIHNFLSGSGAIEHLPPFWPFPTWCAAWGATQGGLALRDMLRDRRA